MSDTLSRIRTTIGDDPKKALKALELVQDWISDQLPIPTRGATAMLVRISTAINVLANNGWQPIETAPKDGREVLVIAGQQSPSGRYFTAYWDDFHDGWYYRAQGFVPKPTHWMPLPPLPQIERAET